VMRIAFVLLVLFVVGSFSWAQQHVISIIASGAPPPIQTTATSASNRRPYARHHRYVPDLNACLAVWTCAWQLDASSVTGNSLDYGEETLNREEVARS
jgi:hypothetical protein